MVSVKIQCFLIVHMFQLHAIVLARYIGCMSFVRGGMCSARGHLCFVGGHMYSLCEREYVFCKRAYVFSL